MAGFYSLLDPKTHTTYSVDTRAMLLCAERDGAIKKCRLEAAEGALLAALFYHHPALLPDAALEQLLGYDQAIWPEVFSSIHQKQQSLAHDVGGFLDHQEGVGVALPSSWLMPLPQKGQVLQLSDACIKRAVKAIAPLIKASIRHVANASIRKDGGVFILDRNLDLAEIERHLALLRTQGPILMRAFHEADLARAGLRVQEILAGLAVCIGLARTSLYPITHAQWMAWHRHEVMTLFAQLNLLCCL
jgi:hypothetical protein